MKAKVKLYSIFRIAVKEYDVDNGIFLELNNESTILDLYKELNIPKENVGMIIINGKIIKNFQVILKNKDIIEILPHFPSGG